MLLLKFNIFMFIRIAFCTLIKKTLLIARFSFLGHKSDESVHANNVQDDKFTSNV